MRYPPEQKEKTREKILASAGRAFRTEGYAASGVKGVMGDAGLTVGGFYAHFDSKEALLAEVLTRSLEQTKNVLLAGTDDLEGEDFVREVARRYLSRMHRDAPADGCALPSLTAEVARQGESTKAEFEAYLTKLLAVFEAKMARDEAIALCCLMVGGVMFARAVESEETSDRILMACKRFATGEVKE